MRFVSWNVNGLRSALSKNFVDFFKRSAADVFCLQEVRATEEQIHLDLPGYDIYWNSAKRKGYAGTAIISRLPFSSVTRGMGIPEHDDEGRLITAELPFAYLVTVYTPNSQRGLTRLDYRTKKWDIAFAEYLKKLEQKKPVIFCGDLNVAHREIDLANPDSNHRNAGFTDEERATFDTLLNSGFIDTFRVFTKEGGHYTWWSNFSRARERNIGWRIDYFCISSALKPKLKESNILPHVYGSDHCPIELILDVTM